MLKFLGPHCFQTLWYLFHVWYDDRCWSNILCSTIPNPVHDFKVKVTDLEFVYWSVVINGCILFLHSSYTYWGNPEYCSNFNVIILLPATRVSERWEYRRKFLQYLFLWILQWILVICGVTIGPCLKILAVPYPSQYMTLISSSQNLNFLC